MIPVELSALFNQANALQDRGELRKAFRLFLRGAEAGDADFAAHVSSCYLSGSGTRRDLHEALRWSKVASRGGRPEYQSNLAIDYAMLGKWRRARHWWERALEGGDLEAATSLALCLLTGKGVCRDPHRAASLLRKVTRAGNEVTQGGREDAMALLGVLCARGIATPRSASRARQWFRRANADGDYPEVARALENLDQVEILDVVRWPVWTQLRR